eukprot:Hpha_TRINITY_DN15820_c0_g1::TRINITY_DN15820_c0_g1_i1::g.187116::m.187116
MDVDEHAAEIPWTEWVEEDDPMRGSEPEGRETPRTPRIASSSASSTTSEGNDALPLRRSYAFNGRCMMAAAQMRQHPVESADIVMQRLDAASASPSGDCSVCLVTSPTSAGSRQGPKIGLPCGHTFHRGCVYEWLVTRAREGVLPTCPNCRAQIPT